MDPNMWYALQNNQLAERQVSPSTEPLTTPFGQIIPACPICGGTAVRSLDAVSFVCSNGGHCNGHRWIAR